MKAGTLQFMPRDVYKEYMQTGAFATRGLGEIAKDRCSKKTLPLISKPCTNGRHGSLCYNYRCQCACHEAGALEGAK